MNKKVSYLRRYTSLPILLDILSNKRLTLLDPAVWEDKNDSYFIQLYKENLGYKTVLALCFSEASETYHHWKIYSGNSSGVCIEFKKNKLIEDFESLDGITHGKVLYKKAGDLMRKSPPLNQLPFFKRYVFRDEREYRFIYNNSKKEETSIEVPISLDCISKITINPWLHESTFKSVKNIILKIEGCDSINIVQTKLLNLWIWKNTALNLFPPPAK